MSIGYCPVFTIKTKLCQKNKKQKQKQNKKYAQIYTLVLTFSQTLANYFRNPEKCGIS